MLGAAGNEHVEGVIMRMTSPAGASKVPWIAVTDRPDMIQSADVISISQFSRAKHALKSKARAGLGIEFLLKPARSMDAKAAAKWLVELADAYSFCESAGCQFILSSGAGCPSEMVSGECFDHILSELQVDSRRHWRSTEQWLNDLLAKKVTLA